MLTEAGVLDNESVPHPDVMPYRPTDEEIAVEPAVLATVPSRPVPSRRADERGGTCAVWTSSGTPPSPTPPGSNG